MTTKARSRIYLGDHSVETLRLADDESTPPVLFLHGWGLTPRAYTTPLHALADRGHAILAPTLPGFGGSDPLPTHRQNVAGVAEHLGDFLDASAHSGPLDVVGHSFGGGVALALAATRPDLVSSLTLICPVGGAGLGRVAPGHLALGALRDGLHSWAPRALADLVPNTVRHPLAVLGTALAAWSADLVETLASVSAHGIDTHLTFARHDGVVSPGALVSTLLPFVSTALVAGRHSWLLSDPQRFAALVDDRLDRLHPPLLAA